MQTQSKRLVGALLTAALACDLGILLLQAGRRPLWYDELLTLHVSSLHPFSLLLSALHAGADGMPPAYYAFVQLARLCPGPPELLLRLPSILGYLLALLGVFAFSCRSLTPPAALTALLLVMLSPFRLYALEARSYALLTGLLAVAAVLWQRIGERRFLTPAFAVFLALAVSVHHLAIVAISIFAAAELARTWLTRRPRWPVWAACLFAALPFLLNLPILLQFRAIFARNFWARPGWSTAAATYREYLPLDFNLGILIVVLYGLWLIWFLRALPPRRPEALSEPARRAAEAVLIGGFLAYPAILVTLSVLAGSGYVPRYGWPVAIGLAIGAVFLFQSVWPSPSSALLPAALLLALVTQSAFQLQAARRPGPVPEHPYWTALAEASRREPGIPVVTGSGFTFLELQRYAPPDLRPRLVQVLDDRAATRLAGTDTVDKASRILAQFVPLRVEELALFRTAHPRFLLYSGGPYEWFPAYLAESRFPLRLVSSAGGRSIYLAGR